MNVIAFKPASAPVDATERLRVSAAHLQILAEALDFQTDSPGTPATTSANDDTLGNRNYMAITPGTQTAAQVAQLVSMGLMECAAGPLWRGQYVHVVTRAGRELIHEFRQALVAPC